MHKAALFEVDKTRLPERMAQAEKAVVLRARELFYFTQPETTSKRGQLWMMRCTPCMLCGTDHKLTAVLRLLRSTRLGLLTISSTRALSVRAFTIEWRKKALT